MKRQTARVTIICPRCKAHFTRNKEHEAERPLLFCAYCSAPLKDTEVAVLDLKATTLIAEHIPKDDEIKKTIGQYQILSSLGKGGMGEVFLAYDTVCGRKIALKQIRGDLMNHPQLQRRFLKEAEITSQLTHPTIIPIYSIHKSPNLVYYTMPYLEGETLKQIIKRARLNNKRQDIPKDPHASIPALMRIFLQVCQAAAYAHSKGVLHRDLKPENVIVGTYGQVIILDWGLATLTSDDTEEILPEIPDTKARITRAGKVVGTIAYMAPERAFSSKANVQTDIYSLGVVLYQILTLSLPFHRKSLKEFKKSWIEEQLIAPELIAPYREVPQILSEVVKRCLNCDPSQRYQSVDELIQSIENYLEGRSEWFLVKELNIQKKSDWQFQENILIPENTAITRTRDTSEWVSVMITKDPFPDNTRLEAKVRIGTLGHGIGFLFSIPSPIDKHHLTEGYCLWLSSENEKVKKTKLTRSLVTVLVAQDITIKQNEWVSIRIEKIDLHIYLYINGILQFSYISHIPIMGTHIGIMARDADFEISPISISIGSQNIQISCLSVPDAFLANRDFDRALQEYRKIATLFPGRAEGREALFRAGITLLEQAKATTDDEIQQMFLTSAHDEFHKLRKTPGAPLEYLGKALIYQQNKEYDEEEKCFELAIRKYRYHPHLLILEEQIAVRLHESARYNRYVAYQFILLVVRHLPHMIEMPSTRRLMNSLERHWEKPFFIEHVKSEEGDLNRLGFCLTVAFWLAKPYAIQETLRELLQKPILPLTEIKDAIYLLIELGAYDIAREEIAFIRSLLSSQEIKKLSMSLEIFECMLSAATLIETGVSAYIEHAPDTYEDIRCLLFLLKIARTRQNKLQNMLLVKKLQNFSSPTLQEHLDAALIESALFFNDDALASTIMQRYKEETLASEKSPLYFAYGCWLCKTAGKDRAIQLFSQLLCVRYPESSLIAAYVLAQQIDINSPNWNKQTFLFEKRVLYQQLALFYRLDQDAEAAQTFSLLEQQQYCLV